MFAFAINLLYNVQGIVPIMRQSVESMTLFTKCKTHTILRCLKAYIKIKYKTRTNNLSPYYSAIPASLKDLFSCNRVFCASAHRTFQLHKVMGEAAKNVAT